MAKKKRKTLKQQLWETKKENDRLGKTGTDLADRVIRQVNEIVVKDIAIERLVLEKEGLKEMLNDSQAMTGRLLMQLSVCKVKADLENIPLHVRPTTMSVNECPEEKKKDA